jgi:uncharacterized repeat protein (TIGR01451 family)
MVHLVSTRSQKRQAGRLPGWWKQLLIAVAMLFFCSCTAPLPLEERVLDEAFRSPQRSADHGAEPQPVDTAQVEGSSPLKESPSVVIEDETPVQPPTWVDIATDQPADEMVDEMIGPSPPAVQGIEHSGPPLTPISQYMGAEYSEGVYAGTGECVSCNGCTYVNGRLVGPSDEYLCDGGDFGSPAGVRADWTIEGLDPEDAVAHYDTLDGRVIITPSNRVCVYAPRFAAVRRVVNLMAHEQPEYVNVALEELSPAKAAESQPVASSLQRRAVGIHLGQQPPSLYRQRQQPGALENLQATMDVYNSLGAYANLQVIRTGVVDNAEKPWLALSTESAITLTGVQAAQVLFGVKAAHAQVGVQQAGIIYQTDGPDNPKLRLIKLVSCAHALPGEEIEFTLRFDNIGDQEIGNVTIADNLSTRFEYIPKTARSSVDANFIVEPSDNESSVLRWEIIHPLKPGDGGVLRFRVRVR